MSMMAARYVGKLRTELEEGAYEVFAGAAERERVKSVLADLAKTCSDFKATSGRALDQLSSAIVPRLRCDACPCMHMQAVQPFVWRQSS